MLVRNKIYLLFILLFFFVINACNKPESPNPDKDYDLSGMYQKYQYNVPAVSFKAMVQGIVTDLDGNPVKTAKIETNGLMTFTDENGIFEISLANFTNDFCYIKISKAGYFVGSSTVHGKKDQNHRVYIQLQPHNNKFAFHSSQGKKIELSNGAMVQFFPNSFVSGNGQLYTGNVNVYVEHLNPQSPKFSLNIPGSDLRGFDRDGEDVLLYSYGMLNVEITDEADNHLQLAKGKISNLVFPVSQQMLASAPSAIPVWYFDEDKGVWIETGVAQLNGNKYATQVTHFTSYNVDVRASFPITRFEARVVNCNNQPVSFARLRVGQVVFMSDRDGVVEGITLNGEQEIDIYDEVNDEFVGLNRKVVIQRTNNIVNLGSIVAPCVASISGQIKDCDGGLFTGYAVIKYGNTKKISFITEGFFSVDVANTGQQAEILFYKPASPQLLKKTITLPTQKGQQVSLQTVTVCNENNKEFEEKLSFTYLFDNKKDDYEMQNFAVAQAKYDPLLRHTVVTFKSKTPQVDSVIIIFEGEGTGYYTSPIGIEGYPYISIYANGAELDIYQKNISLTILGYNKTTKWVSGAFDGIFAFSGDPRILSKPAYISNGIFSAPLKE